MNQYIKSCLDGVFDFETIRPDNFIQFLKFIDQYPTKILSIDQIEKEIIMYMIKNQIQPNEYILNMCTKYQLKRLYFYLKQNFN